MFRKLLAFASAYRWSSCPGAKYADTSHPYQGPLNQDITMLVCVFFLVCHDVSASIFDFWRSRCPGARLADIHTAGGQGVLGQDLQARASLTQAASAAPGADALGPALDYLISCSYNSSADELSVLAGNNQGAVGCFAVQEPATPGAACSFRCPTAVMAGAHDSVRGS